MIYLCYTLYVPKERKVDKMYRVKTIFNDGTCKVEDTNNFRQAIGAFTIYMENPEVEYTCIMKKDVIQFHIIAIYDVRGIV